MVIQNSTEIKRERGGVLRRARRQAGLSARELSERINDRTPGSDLTENAIYAYESGRVMLSRESAERVSAVLRLPLGELMVGDPDFSGGEAGSEVPSHLARAPSATSVRVAPIGRAEDRVLRRLHDLAERVLQTGETLARMLGVSRFELGSPVGFVHGFELLAADLDRLLGHEDLRELERGEPGPRSDAVEVMKVAAQEVRRCASEGYPALRRAGEAGSCAQACVALSEELTAKLDALAKSADGLVAIGGLKPALGGAVAVASRT